MSSASQIMAELRADDLLLTRNGDRLRIDSPLGRPLPGELKQRILAHRAELLAWLAWNEWADEQLLAMTRRIAAAYRPGCPIDTPAWHEHDHALDEAYRAHDDATLLAAIGCYEMFAERCFAAYQAGTRGERSR